jgi:hypothetical protein
VGGFGEPPPGEVVGFLAVAGCGGLAGEVVGQVGQPAAGVVGTMAAAGPERLGRVLAGLAGGDHGGDEVVEQMCS